MSRFDRVIVADWSASSALSPVKESSDAIWLGITDQQGTTAQYFRSRALAEAALRVEIGVAKGRVLIGFDFPMGYPAGFAARLAGTASARAVWAWIAARMQDGADNRNNRFDVAATMNRAVPGGPGPFWARPAGLDLPDLPTRKTIDYTALGLAERRQVETLVPRAQPVWKLYTTGAAGSQGLVGQAMIHRIAALPGVAVWPFDPPNAPVVLAEIYPSLLAKAVSTAPKDIKDKVQVSLLSRALWQLGQTGGLEALLATPPAPVTTEEGWILGAGHVAVLQAALA